MHARAYLNFFSPEQNLELLTNLENEGRAVLPSSKKLAELGNQTFFAKEVSSAAQGILWSKIFQKVGYETLAFIQWSIGPSSLPKGCTLALDMGSAALGLYLAYRAYNNATKVQQIAKEALYHELKATYDYTASFLRYQMVQARDRADESGVNACTDLADGILQNMPIIESDLASLRCLTDQQIDSITSELNNACEEIAPDDQDTIHDFQEQVFEPPFHELGDILAEIERYIRINV